MPAVDVDLDEIPDIIEAQLTLSYSRLSDLIRIIISQGNEHEDDIVELRRRMDELEKENQGLREEMHTLRDTKSEDRGLGEVVESLRKDVERIAKATEDAATYQAEENSRRQKIESEMTDSVQKATAASQESLQRLASTTERLQNVEKSQNLCEAFMHLWGTQPMQLLEMGSRSSEDTEGFAHTIDERTNYLHTLPAFTRLYDEVELLRTLMQKQAADALATKTAAAGNAQNRHRPPLKDSLTASDNQSVEDLLNTVSSLQGRVESVEKKRLPPLEEQIRQMRNSELMGVQANRNSVSGEAGGPVGDISAGDAHVEGSPTSCNSNAELEKAMQLVQDHLAHLDGRLNVLVGHAKRADGSVDHPGLVDLANRISLLEETVEGISSKHKGSQRHSNPLVQGTPLQGAHPDKTEFSSGACGESRPFDTPSSNAEPTAATGGRLSSQIGTPNEAGHSCLPPLLQVSQEASPVSHPDNVPLSPASRKSSSSRHIDQPAVGSLRRRETATPVSVQKVTRSVSFLADQDAGLRRRMAQLEENTALLELNKADRSELHMLEEAVRLVVQRMETNTGATTLNPQPPGAQSGPFMKVGGDGRRQSPEMPRPQTSMVGRPRFVAHGGSINLRDGAMATSATVSTCSTRY